MKLHLTITKDFNYFNYLSLMSAIKNYDVILWILEEPEDNKWWTIAKNTMNKINIRPTTREKGIILSIKDKDKTGRLDIIYLGGELPEDYAGQAELKHELFKSKDEGEFERKDVNIVRVHESVEDIDVEWVKTSDTLLAELIKTVLLERVWNAYNE